MPVVKHAENPPRLAFDAAQLKHLYVVTVFHAVVHVIEPVHDSVVIEIREITGIDHVIAPKRPDFLAIRAENRDHVFIKSLQSGTRRRGLVHQFVDHWRKQFVQAILLVSRRSSWKRENHLPEINEQHLQRILAIPLRTGDQAEIVPLVFVFRLLVLPRQHPDDLRLARRRIEQLREINLCQRATGR